MTLSKMLLLLSVEHVILVHQTEGLYFIINGSEIISPRQCFCLNILMEFQAKLNRNKVVNSEDHTIFYIVKNCGVWSVRCSFPTTYI